MNSQKSHRKILALIKGSTTLASTRLGGYVFGKVVRSLGFETLLTRIMLEFMAETDEARAQEVAKVAAIAGNLMVKIFSEPRPPAVKRAFEAMMEGFAGVSRRDAYRAQYGAAPSFYTLNPTQECNLGCWGCYDNCKRAGPHLSLDEMDWVVSSMKDDFGIHFAVISGGEPFIRIEELGELARRHRDVVFMVYTNGTLITPAVIKLLAELGNVSPAISLEGDEAETDKRRGKGHFQKMMEMIQMLRDVGIIYGFSATMTSQNAQYLTSDRFAHWCQSKGYLFGWFFQYIPIGRHPDMDLMATPEQRMALGKHIRGLRMNGFPMLLADFWNDGHLTDGCIAGGRRYVHINGSGDLKPCVFTQVAVKDGNIRSIMAGQSPYKSLAQAVLESPLMVKFRENQEELKAEGLHRWRPCSVIDRPDLFRELCQIDGAVPLTPDLCPEAILHGEIADGLDQYAWAFADVVEVERKRHREAPLVMIA